MLLGVIKIQVSCIIPFCESGNYNAGIYWYNIIKIFSILENSGSSSFSVKLIFKKPAPRMKPVSKSSLKNQKKV